METQALTSPSHTASKPGPGLSDITPVVDVVVVAGPPVVFLAAPWLLFGLLLAAPFAAALTITAVVVVATLAVALVVAVLASPLVLFRYLRDRERPAPAPEPETEPATPHVVLSAPRLWPVGA